MENSLMTYDEAHAYLDDVTEGLPPTVFRDLNGGILLLERTVLSPHSLANDLYTLGTYFYDPYGLGRYIAIYYGSFVQLYRYAPREAQQKALRDVLLHELTHHVEGMAGVRDLEEEDRIFLEKYRKDGEMK